LVENSARVGARVLARCQAMEKRFEILGQARGQGLVLGLEIVKDKASKQPAPDLAQEIVQRSAQQGLLMIAPIGLYGNVLRIAPPLVITEKEADTGCDILESVFAGLAA